MTYRHLRDQHRWTLVDVLEAQAQERPDTVFVATVEGEALTYADTWDQAGRVAALLAESGVRPGDAVAVLMPNSLDFVRVWSGTAYAGAALVPINHALTGDFLAHQLRVSGAEVVVCHPDFLDALAAVCDDAGAVRTVLTPAPAAECGGLRTVPLEAWREAAPAPRVPVQSRDIACVMFTSGTTGPSKGVLMPHAHCYLLGLGVVDNLELGPDDRYYVAMPLYHANALFMQLYGTLIAGAGAVLRTRFSASTWLSDIREHGCTVTNLLGAMAQFVIGLPPQPTDRDHRLRVILPAPNPPAHEQAWRERFGIPDVVSAWGMTEANVPLYCRLSGSRPGAAGYAYEPYFEVRLHDPETDEPVPPGTPGEICVRSTVPYGFCAGYKGQADATVQAFRNFWFHTGDLGVMDADGCFTYLDRTKDCIRRRGENISSFEVEAAMVRHPGIREVAAFAVAAGAAGTEDEVMLAIVPADAALTVADVVTHADAVLPRFARPRYVDLVDALPKTPTERVQKSVLRERGVRDGTWDRERHARAAVPRPTAPMEAGP
jgi:crotonobetaine/carnitine-CoA ligase